MSAHQTNLLDRDMVETDDLESSDTENTPLWLVDLVIDYFEGIPGTDPCTNRFAAIPARRKYTIADDGLTRTWKGTVWLNPPYSAPAPWLERLIWSSLGGLALLKHDHSTNWWRDYCRGQMRCEFTDRIRFTKPKQGAARGAGKFCSSLVLFESIKGDREAQRARFASIFCPVGEIVSEYE